MESKVSYTAVGIFVVVLGIFLIIGTFWMTTVGNKDYKPYLVYVHEDVTGLSAESPVRFNGVKVGYVESISLDANNPKLVKLMLRIDPHVLITTSTYAVLNAQGVTGVVYVNLKADSEQSTPLLAAKGQPYPVIPSRPSLLMQLSTVLPEIAKDVQDLSANISQVLDKQNRESIATSLKNVANVSQVLADNANDFTQTLASLDNAMANISEASNDLPATVKKLNNTLGSVDSLSLQMSKASESVSVTMHNFSNQVIPNAQEALSHLSQATESMSQLSQQLERNPSMLVRGKVPAQPGPGEK